MTRPYLLRRLGDTRFAWKLALSYSIIVILVLAGQAAYFSRLHNQMESELQRTGELLLSHSTELVDRAVESVKRAATQLSANPDIREFAYATRAQRDVAPLDLYRLSRSLPDLTTTLDEIARVLLHFRDPDVFVGLGTASSRAGLYFNANLVDPTLMYESWHEMVYDGTYRPGFAGIEQTDLASGELMYISYTPVAAVGNPLGAIIVLLDTSTLLKQVDEFLVSGDAGLVITEPGGLPLASLEASDEMLQIARSETTKPSITLDGDAYSVLRAESAGTGWIYHAFVPTSVLMSQANKMRRVSIMVLLGMLSLFVALIAAFASSLSRPIREISSMLAGGDARESGDELSRIRGGLSSLMDRNAGLQRDLLDHENLLRSSFLSQLFLNGFRNRDALNLYVQTAGLDLGSSGYRILLAGVAAEHHEADSDAPTVEQRPRVLAVRMLADWFDSEAQIQTVESDRIAMLLTHQRPDESHVLTRDLEHIASRLWVRNGVRLYIACGDIIDDLSLAPRQFRLLSEHMNLVGLHRSTMVFVDKVTTPETYFSYPIDTEVQLVTLLKMGDSQEALRVVDNLLEENAAKASDDLNELFRALAGTYLRCANELLSPPEFAATRNHARELERSLDRDAFLSQFTGLVRRLSETIGRNHESHNTKLRDAIIEYIAEHFADPLMNLYSVARAFDLNEKYLSRFFRDQTGGNFSSWLERIRMENAARMLEATDATVDAIAEASGYGNANTFHKAFRRRFNTTPGKYRQLSTNRTKNTSDAPIEGLETA